MKSIILIGAAVAALGTQARAEEVYDFQFEKAAADSKLQQEPPTKSGTKFQKLPEAEVKAAEPTPVVIGEPSQKISSSIEKNEYVPDRRTRFAFTGAWSTMTDAAGKNLHGADIGFQWLPFKFFGLEFDLNIPVEQPQNDTADYYGTSATKPIEPALGIILTPFRTTIGGRDFITLSAVAGGMTYQSIIKHDFGDGGPSFARIETRTGIYAGGLLAINFVRQFGIYGQYRWIVDDSSSPPPSQLTAGMAVRF